jgi:hypothetical protein
MISALKIIVWFALIALAAIPIMRHQYTPGAGGLVSENWPSSSSVPLSQAGKTLVFFAHPSCPCTRTSLDELAKALTRCRAQVTAYAVMSTPKGMETDPDLARAASRIPGLLIVQDGRKEAGHFGVRTSGHVLVYAPDGARLYSGGITGARGHRGDNNAEDAVVAILHGAAVTASAPVFGCALTSPNTGDSCCAPSEALP